MVLREFIDRNQAVECYEDTEIWLVSSDPFTGFPPPEPPDPTDPHPPQEPPQEPPPTGAMLLTVWYEDVVLLVLQ